MKPELNRDYREFIALLNSNDVKYVVVGGYAVAHYGAPRYTGDIDFLVEPSDANAKRVIQVLVDFGFGSLRLKPSDLSKPDQFVHMGKPPVRIDVLTSIAGVDFKEVYKKRINATIDGVRLPLICKDHLIQNKLATGRSKDLTDAELLQKRDRIRRKKKPK